MRIPMNLPHAATLSRRIEYYVRIAIPERGPQHAPLLQLTDRLQVLLGPIGAAGDDPPREEALAMAAQAAALGRSIVDGVEEMKLGHDRLGQAIRNLFECLELGEEGAALSLRAGENPNSALR